MQVHICAQMLQSLPKIGSVQLVRVLTMTGMRGFLVMTGISPSSSISIDVCVYMCVVGHVCVCI